MGKAYLETILTTIANSVQPATKNQLQLSKLRHKKSIHKIRWESFLRNVK